MLRWPHGFACPRCGHAGGWRLGDGRFEYKSCGCRTSVTGGTIFDKTRTPFTVWFTVCWMFGSSKDGVSALSMERTLEIGSYHTVWAMLHRLNSVLVRPGRDPPAGTMEVDLTYIGGEEPALRGGRARSRKVLTGVAVDVHEPQGLGWCRIAPLEDTSADSLHAFITDHVASGTTVTTDGKSGHRGQDTLGYIHDWRSQGPARAHGADPGELLPAVHRIPSLVEQ